MSQWQETEKGLYKHFEFNDFKEAFAFMGRVAEVAERAGHHPEWSNSYNSVDIWLVSHDAGDSITEKDHRLAVEIDKRTV